MKWGRKLTGVTGILTIMPPYYNIPCEAYGRFKLYVYFNQTDVAKVDFNKGSNAPQNMSNII